jgi:hypothetical protein
MEIVTVDVPEKISLSVAVAVTSKTVVLAEEMAVPVTPPKVQVVDPLAAEETIVTLYVLPTMGTTGIPVTAVAVKVPVLAVFDRTPALIAQPPVSNPSVHPPVTIGAVINCAPMIDEISTFPLPSSASSVPVWAGRVSADEPSAPVGGEIVIVPLAAFLKSSCPTADPATPRVRFPLNSTRVAVKRELNR